MAPSVYLTSREIQRWLAPWPIHLRGARSFRWRLRILPLSKVERFYAFWKTGPRQVRRTIGWWADQCAKYKSPSEQHYIHMLARDRVPVLRSLTIVAIQRGGKMIVLDANHTTIATALVRRHGFQGATLGLKWVGVLIGQRMR